MEQDDDIQLLDRVLFQQLIDLAQVLPRRRTNHNFHRSMEENSHRFLNVMARGTYVAPHRHLDPPKSESFVILQGEIGFFTFDDVGEVVSCNLLGSDPIGIDIQPGVWHTMVVLSEHAVCFEVKPGPYSESNDKDFAPWAPREGDPQAASYLQHLVERARNLMAHG